MMWFWLLACRPDAPVLTTDSASAVTAETGSASTTTTSTGAPTTEAELDVRAALASLVNGHACRGTYNYAGYDEAHVTSSYRLGIFGHSADAPLDPTEGDRLEGDVADQSVVLVEGTCVWVVGCTDVVHADCDQRLERLWVGTGGTLVLEHTATGVKGELRDLELTAGDPGLPPSPNPSPGWSEATVRIDVVELPERAYWVE